MYRTHALLTKNVQSCFALIDPRVSMTSHLATRTCLLEQMTTIGCFKFLYFFKKYHVSAVSGPILKTIVAKSSSFNDKIEKHLGRDEPLVLKIDP